MVKKTLRFRKWLVLLAVLMLFVVAKEAYAVENSSYDVVGEPIHWVVHGMPGSSRDIEWLEFELVRTNDSESLRFSLSELVDINDSSNEFPRELIVVKTDYDSAPMTFGSVYTQVKLLDSKDERANIWIGLHYRSDVRAGTYTGSLYSDQGNDVTIEIVVNRFTDVAATSTQISLEVPHPGTWTTEFVQVEVDANHNDWVVSLSSKGLFLADNTQDSLQSSLQETQVHSLGLMALLNDRTFSLLEGYKFSGSEYGAGGIFTFRIQAETALQHKAGHYTGVIQVDVQVNDE